MWFKMKKRNLHFSDKFEAELDDLIALAGLRGTYGAVPRCLAFSVSFSLEMLKRLESVTPDLDGDKMVLFSTCIQHVRDRERILDSREKLAKMEAEVTPQHGPK